MYNARRAAALMPVLVAVAFTAACDDGYKVVDVRPEGELTESRTALYPGDSLQLVAELLQNEVFFPFASSLHVLYDSRARPPAFRWSVPDTTVATVSSTGMLRVRGAGRTSVEARAEGVTGTFPVHVEAPRTLRD